MGNIEVTEQVLSPGLEKLRLSIADAIHEYVVNNVGEPVSGLISTLLAYSSVVMLKTIHTYPREDWARIVDTFLTMYEKQAEKTVSLVVRDFDSATKYPVGEEASGYRGESN